MLAPLFSLVVPTRGRPRPLRDLLESIRATASRPDRIEIILVVDDDDPNSRTFETCRPLNIRYLVGPPGRTMGALNNAGCHAARGEFIMLLNDDVIIRTRGWDRTVTQCFRRFPDPIALVHVNDTLMRDHLCTFPIVPRAYYDLMGEICPEEYERYRIDDHIEDVFNMLSFVGVRRSVYLPDVIFEHRNAVNHPTAGRVYESDPEILGRDAPRFDRLLPQRKEQALRALEVIGGATDGQRSQLESVADSFALRISGRQIVVRSAWWRRAPGKLLAHAKRIRRCYERSGSRGLASAALRRLLPVG